jgi:hypothetical protein
VTVILSPSEIAGAAGWPQAADLKSAGSNPLVSSSLISRTKIMTIMDNNLTERKCLLDDCDITFKPSVYWQIFCCPKHADKARKTRQRDRIKRGLALLDSVEGTVGDAIIGPPSCCGGVGCNSCEPQGRG